MKQSLIIFAAVLGSYAGTAVAAPLPPWLPVPVQIKVNTLAEKKAGHPLATLYLCDPYCEAVGTFFSKTFFAEVSKDFAKQAALPSSAPHLRLFIEYDPQESSVLKDHDAQEVDHAKIETVDSDGEESKQDNADDSSNPEISAAEAEAQKEDEADRAGQTPLRLGIHIDTLLGASSLSTSSNTDTASDALTHGILGGGFDFVVRDLFSIGKGSVVLDTDLSSWISVAQKSQQNVAGESWNTQTYRALLGLIWRKPKSPWRLGVLLEGRDENRGSTPDTAISFSTQYIWISPGISIQYGKTTLRILPSVYASTQDVAQYRGTQISSKRLAFEIESCKSVANVLNGYFAICGRGSFEKLSVSGSGAPIQPVFTSDPTYSYSTWTAGLEFKLAEISL